MKISFEIDTLQEGENYIKVYMNAPGMYAILHDLDNYLRNKVKHGEHSKKQLEVYEEIRSKLYELGIGDYLHV